MSGGNKKILLIAPLPPPFGGIAFITRALLNAGLKEKFDVVHLNTSKNTLTESIDKITIKGIYLSVTFLFRLFFICFKEKNIQYALILGSNGSTIIRIAAYLVILRVFRIRTITNLHGTRFINQRNRVIKKINIFVIKKSKLILSPTIVDRNAILQNIKTNNVKLFYNSTYIDTELYEKTKVKTNGSELNIIGIGRLSRAKGAYELIETCSALLKEGYKITLTWVGRGAYVADDRYADDLISKLDVNLQSKIQIFRDVEDKEKYKLLSNSDVFILPTYTDNLPIAIIEAMAFGLPVISTLIGEIPEVIKENINGWCISPGDIGALKKIILLVLDNRKSLQDISTRNRNDFLEKFSTKKRVAELEEYLK